ncbi:GntR family transcriptional repressor for pyruvate dehydrogenase complex [Pseudorhizobium tarimense]|uniref:GntR family transcriptional repressor for pyruvate dehydrogenase complex n=1 Tax=Pseudorhizobium tarimense TaxID=1079109 RepID=A0ABV2HCV1_9HYPH|nr:FCD domain-containing protein [Pseudorhizobium tarimense]MCJ8521439.1 FCD domain-containing protein [Pseudorhizobium tarimense]
MSAATAPEDIPAANVVFRQSAQEIADELIRQIRRGEISQDDALPTERDLCAHFDASRPTIREALALVQHKGYIEAGGGRRPRARRPALADVLRNAGGTIRDILGDVESNAHLEQMRGFIEVGAVREAAIRAGTVDISRIGAALDSNRQAIGTAAFAQTDIMFHRAIVAVAANPVILTLHDMFVSELLAARPAERDPATRDRIVYDEHRAIFDALIRRDGHAAIDEMDRHLARSFRDRLARPGP